MRWKLTKVKIGLSIILGLIIGSLFGLHEVCNETCSEGVKEIAGFTYNINNNNILATLIFSIPFVIFIYLIYSLLQKNTGVEKRGSKCAITETKSKTVKPERKHLFGWQDLTKEMLWETILEGIIILSVVALLVIYLVLYVFGDKPRPEWGWMLWAILGLLGVVLVTAGFYLAIFVRFLRLEKKGKKK